VSRRVEHTPEIIAAVRDCRAAGRSLTVTSERVGVDTKVVRSIILRELGTPIGRSGNPTPWTPERVALLLALRRDGASRRAIARELGVTHNAVCGKLHRLRMEARERPPDYPADDRDRAYDAGGE
jgi:hypothetical protein